MFAAAKDDGNRCVQDGAPGLGEVSVLEGSSSCTPRPFIRYPGYATNLSVSSTCTCAAFLFPFLYVCKVVRAAQCVLWSPDAVVRKLLFWNRRKRRICSIPCGFTKGSLAGTAGGRGAPLTVPLGH